MTTKETIGKNTGVNMLVRKANECIQKEEEEFSYMENL